MKKCIIKDCERKYRCQGYCDMHYRRFLVHGDPLKGPLKKCLVDICETKPRKLGMCEKHYARFKKWGDPHKYVSGRAPNLSLCKHEGCSKKHRTKGFCTIHYQRLLKHGDTNTIGAIGKHEPKFPTMKDRFLNSFEMITESGCWVWGGSVNESGYGQMTWKNRSYSAHRFSYQQFVGSIPESMCVLHQCDVPSCVNPNHLFLGTNQDNMKDKVSKERQAKGEKQGSAKLTTVQVMEILGSNNTFAALANKYGVQATTVANIKKRKTWVHIV